MSEYHSKLIKAHLEKESQKFTAIASTKEVTEVILLKPELKSVQLYTYPDEHVVVLEGENLWFCHEIILGGKKSSIRPDINFEAITGRAIQYSSKPTKESAHLGTKPTVKVTMCSHFANIIRKQEIPIEQVSSFHVAKIRYVTSEKFVVN